jgi:hypothetical protein
MATANKPTGPRRTSQWGINEWCARAAGAGAKIFTKWFDATCDPRDVWRSGSTGPSYAERLA